MDNRYHTTVTSALQTVARLARASPYVATLVVPTSKAAQVAAKQCKRYPTITANARTLSALRRAQYPAVQLVVMPPDGDSITMLLLSNTPPDDREAWQLATNPDQPLTWRNYSLTTDHKGSITWRLSEAARVHYRQRLARLITQRGVLPGDVPDVPMGKGLRQVGTPPRGHGARRYQLPDDTASAQVYLLAQHLNRYPGCGGVRRDVYQLAQHSTRMWRSTRPDSPYPQWPKMPFVRFRAAQTAPLTALPTQKPTQKKEAT